MVDTDLLADVYIELLGGKQPGLSLTADDQAKAQMETSGTIPQAGKTHRPLRGTFPPSADEIKAHQTLLMGLMIRYGKL